MNKKDIKKVVLAYSGGLDTSIIIPWLKQYQAMSARVQNLTDLKKKPLQPVLQSFTFLTLKKNM